MSDQRSATGDQQSLLRIRVECYAGYRGDERPQTLVLGDRRIEVAEVIDQWLAPDHRYFKLRDADANLYIVRYSATDDSWELTLFERGHVRP